MAKKKIKAAEPQGVVASAIEAAPNLTLPDRASPQLASLAPKPPSNGEWRYEIKYDGYRILARIEGGQTRLFTRNGNDWTDKMASLANELGKLKIKSAWIDGEAVVLNDEGLPDFNALQNAFDRHGTEKIVYYAFDVLFVDGKDVRGFTQLQRSALLRLIWNVSGHTERVRLSEVFDAPPQQLLDSACKAGLEGIMAKRQDAPYSSSRSTAWLKLKCNLRQEFVIAGFVDRSDGARVVGSLLLGVYSEDGVFLPAGSVGTGWDAATAASLRKQLVELAAKTSPFEAGDAPKRNRWSRGAPSATRWVQPIVVAEVQFTEWTPDGSIRHASFKGIRTDKDPRTIRRE